MLQKYLSCEDQFTLYRGSSAQLSSAQCSVFPHHNMFLADYKLSLVGLKTEITGSVPVWLEDKRSQQARGGVCCYNSAGAEEREERGGWRNQYQTGDIAGGRVLVVVVVVGSYQCNERETMERLLRTGGYLG